jgi:hypothetical protein
MARASLAVALLVALVACGGGGGGPTTPPVTTPPAASGWPAGTVLELVDGETGAAVAGQVTIAGVAVQAGAPLATAAAAGATVDVTVAGFLPRQTVVRAGETRLVLWPDTAAFPAAYSQALVFTSEMNGSAAPLKRLPSRVRSIAIAPSAAYSADGESLEALRAAVAGLNVALAGTGVSYFVGGSGDFTVPVHVDSGNAECGGARRGTTSTWFGAAGEITRSEVVFCGLEFTRNVGTVTHELGHTFGLRHSSDQGDLMAALYRPSRAAEPTGRERLAMTLMLQRRPGTTWPDNDRNAAAAARGFELVVD